MKLNHFHLVFLTVLALSLLPFGDAKAAWDMGSENLGTITMTRGETKTIDAYRVYWCAHNAYNYDYTMGWSSGTDNGFYAHSYQNDERSKFSVTAYATCYQQKLSCDVYYTQSDGTYCVKHFYYLVTVNNDSYTKKESDIELVAAGTLSWRISSSDKNSITHLTLHGDLNGDDLRFLREMAGYNDNQGDLRYLDIRDAHFVPGGSSYCTIYSDEISITDTCAVPEGAFFWCRKLTEIWLPEDTKYISTYAFYHCDYLTTVHIPEGTESIYGQNFHVCYNLRELSIPSTVKSFYPQFESSYKFRTLYCYAATPPTRGTYKLFANCTTLYVPQGCKNDYLAKEGWGSIANIYETLPSPKLLLTANPAGGLIQRYKSVTLKASANDAEIYYTIDGTTPSKSSTKYVNGVKIEHPLTLKAIAYHNKYKDSDVLTEEYTVKFKPNEYFTANTIEGVEVSYQIADDDGNTCKVYFVSQNTTGKVTIPEEVYGMPVVEISSERGFRTCRELTSVSLPSTMKRIGSMAFYWCSSLSSITGLNNVEYIGSSAFYLTPWLSSLDDGLIYIGKALYKYKGTMPENTEIYVTEGTLSITPYALSSSNLLTVSIPKSVKEMDGTPIGSCSGLKNIIVASGNTVFDSRGNCNAIIETSTNKLITGCSSTVIPSTVKVIGTNAFYANAPEELLIPNSVDSIASQAIKGKALKKLTIGSGVRKIESKAICETSVNNISVASNNPYFDSRNNCNAIIEKSTQKLLFGCPTTIIPNTVKTIATDAFYTNTDGFNYGRITIPESVEKIEQYAFEKCSSLESVVIGSNVNEIGEYAFYDCNGLAAIYVLSNNPIEISDKVFYCSWFDDHDKIYNSATLVVPNGTRVNYRSTAGWNKFSKIIEGDVNTVVEGMRITEEPFIYKITSTSQKTCRLTGTTGNLTGSVVIPSQVNGYSVTEVSTYALNDQDITDLTIPATVQKLYGNPHYFNNIPNLTSIIVDAGNPKYDSRGGCNAVIETATNKLVIGCQTTVIPDNVTHIGCYAFANMTTMEMKDIPNSVTVIDTTAFYNTGLKEFTIPSSVQRIGTRAFYNCKNLSVVTSMIEQPFDIDEQVFSYYEANNTYFTEAKLRVPYGKKSVYAATEGWKKFQVIEEMEPSNILVTSISLNKSSLSLQTGQSETLTPTILPTNATNQTVTWSSSNTSIANVDNDGKVTAKAKGSATITCMANDGSGVQSTCSVTVTDPEPIAITISPSSKTIIVGETFYASYTLTPSNATTTVTWSSDNDNVATVTQTGLVKGISAGYTWINVKTANGKTDYFRLTVNNPVIPVTSISLNKSSLSLQTGQSESLTATVKPDNATDKTVTWTSYPTSVATVDDNGKVTAVAVGSATITCTANDGSGKKATCSVSVTEGPIIFTDISQYSNIIYTEPATASPESTLTLPVKMKNAQANITGFQFDLVLPAGVSVAKDEDDFYLVDLSTDRTTAKKHTVSASMQADGSIRVVCYSNNNSTFSGLNGNILELTLQTSASVETGDLPIKLRDVVMTTPNMDNYNIGDVICKLTIEDYMLGDVNSDKLVNVVDVAGAVNLIMNTGDTSKLNRKAADVNKDNTINVIDVAGIVNIIMGNVSNARMEAPALASGQSRLYMDSFSMEPGETKTVSVNMSNPGDSFTGCQFDLYLPNGLSVVEEDGFPLIEIGNRTTARKHTVSATTQDDGSLRVVCYSNNNYSFSGEDGEILTITLHAADDASSGIFSVWMRNITLSRPDVTGVSPEDTSAEVTIAGDEPGILASVNYETTEPEYVEKTVRLSSEQVNTICQELGISSLEEGIAYGYNPTTKELVKNYASYDGWRDANGDFHYWNRDGTQAPACVKYTDGQNYLCYNRSGMEPQTIKCFWAIANAEKAVLVEIDFTYAVPEGITTVDADEQDNVKVFNLNGQQVKNPKKGLYIVRSSEGRLQGKNGKKSIVK